ncbi:alkaline phosphatase [Alteromonas antoniana]|uniref:alkaline phosphatase n=1 Tax=Alteromonas antoniana TaxID=2803813 RepID=UPI001C451877|nr:alkaline phosphatase [Alteromonas antoniana]
MFRQSTLFAILSAALLGGCAQVSSTTSSTEATSPTAPKNIIMVVADGMGPAYTTAYRNYQDNPDTAMVEPVVFDDILVGNASTYPAQESGYVTDSAASATALASGVKSYNGAIGVDSNRQPVKSVLHLAKERGMRTGLAVTSQIVHATPASYVAHNESRKNYDALAESFFDDRINNGFVVDVMLGGGTKYFEREDRDIVAEFIDAGFQYADSYNSLAAVPRGEQVLGLFAPVGLPPALDDKRKNRLAYLTEHAIKHLENDNGFFLLVEASQVDWAGHSNDIASAMAEMHDLALTMDYLKSYVKANPDTLVVLTADHSTGGLTIGAKGDYRWSPEFLKNMKASVSAIAMAMTEEDAPGAFVADQLGFSLADDEVAHFDDVATLDDAERVKALKAFLDGKTNTGWTTSGHTGVDVEVFAFGSGADALRGQLDNTDIAKRLMAFVEKRPASLATSPVDADEKRDESNIGTDGEGCDFKEDWRCM